MQRAAMIGHWSGPGGECTARKWARVKNHRRLSLVSHWRCDMPMFMFGHDNHGSQPQVYRPLSLDEEGGVSSLVADRRLKLPDEICIWYGSSHICLDRCHGVWSVGFQGLLFWRILLGRFGKVGLNFWKVIALSAPRGICFCHLQK